jgi:hypothetical protein
MLVRMDRKLAAGFFVVGTLLISIFYGMRWFSRQGLRSNVAASTTAWPPILNPCPDYFQKKVLTDGTIECEDTKNYWSLSSPGGTSPFTLTTQSGNNPDKVRVFTPTDKGITTTRIQEILGANPKLTWEGIYDGASQTTRTPF